MLVFAEEGNRRGNRRARSKALGARAGTIQLRVTLSPEMEPRLQQTPMAFYTDQHHSEELPNKPFPNPPGHHHKKSYRCKQCSPMTLTLVCQRTPHGTTPEIYILPQSEYRLCILNFR